MVRERIRTEVEALEQSQAKFSRSVGVAPPNFNSFLQGTRTLPYQKLVRVLDELGLTVGPRNHGASIMPPSELPEIFRQEIEVSGMKIREVAEQAQIDQACLSTFLNGSRTTPLRNIESLMHVLNLDVVKLIRPKTKVAS